MELMEAMIPLKLRWSALWLAYLCNNTEFLDLARRSGVLHVNLGIESIDADMNRYAGRVLQPEVNLLTFASAGHSVQHRILGGELLAAQNGAGLGRG